MIVFCIKTCFHFLKNLDQKKFSPITKLYNFINAVKELEEEYKAEPEPERKTPEEIFRKVLIATIVKWAEEAQIETPKLVQEMFRYSIASFFICFPIIHNTHF